MYRWLFEYILGVESQLLSPRGVLIAWLDSIRLDMIRIARTFNAIKDVT